MHTPNDQHWSTYYDQGKDFILVTSQALDDLLSHVDPSLPKTCLDIGCGTGQLTRELNHRGYNCVGIDASTSAVDRAKSLTAASGMQYLHFDIESDDMKMLSNKTYSLITCKLVYAFIKDKESFLSKVEALLADKGVFVVITPLIEDVMPEKVGIAVDYEKTLAELRYVFKNVKSFKSQGATTFVCSQFTVI